MIRTLQFRRKRLSFLMANVSISVVSFIVISLSGAFFSISVFEHHGNTFKTLEYIFSMSWAFGAICELVYVVAGFFTIIINAQRLRDMGYRMPVVISIFLMLLDVFSSFITWLVGMNFISIAIDTGLIIFFFVMLFTLSKEGA